MSLREIRLSVRSEPGVPCAAPRWGTGEPHSMLPATCGGTPQHLNTQQLCPPGAAALLPAFHDSALRFSDVSSLPPSLVMAFSLNSPSSKCGGNIPCAPAARRKGVFLSRSRTSFRESPACLFTRIHLMISLIPLTSIHPEHFVIMSQSTAAVTSPHD